MDVAMIAAHRPVRRPDILSGWIFPPRFLRLDNPLRKLSEPAFACATIRNTFAVTCIFRDELAPAVQAFRVQCPGLQAFLHCAARFGFMSTVREAATRDR